MNDEGEGSIIFLVIFVCCVVSCAIGLIVWANGGTLPGGLSISQIKDALAGVKFTRAEQDNITQYNLDNGSFQYNLMRNAITNAGSDLGPPISGKTQNNCDALCHRTTGCVGYTIDDTTCQLKNNVTTLQFKPNTSNLYASGDIGGVLFMYFPYTKIDDGIYSKLWSFTGSLADAVSNCNAHKDRCNGFTWDGNKADMYPTILAIDGSSPQTSQKGVYTNPTKQPQYVYEPKQGYSDTPTNTTTEIFPKPNPFNPTKDSDYFTLWRSGWSAGPDSFALKNDGIKYGPGSTAQSNIITVADLNQCMNVCLSNSWCQSLVFDNNVKSCYMRRDQVAWPPRSLDRSSQDPCRPADNGIQGPGNVSCPCGFVQGSISECNTNIINSHGGMGDGNKVTYARMNPPLAQFCPQQCSNDVNCVLAWYDTSNQQCNTYDSVPTQVQTNQQTKGTTWMINNFPG